MGKLRLVAWPKIRINWAAKLPPSITEF